GSGLVMPCRRRLPDCLRKRAPWDSRPSVPASAESMVGHSTSRPDPGSGRSGYRWRDRCSEACGDRRRGERRPMRARTIPGPDLKLLGRSRSAFRVCGSAGLLLAAVLALVLTAHAGLSTRVIAGLVCTAMATFFGLVI